jgi:hypothetical protein
MADDEMEAKFKRASEIAGKVPQHLQEAAFNRALDVLLGRREPTPNRRTRRLSKTRTDGGPVPSIEVPSASTFFSQLANESGIPEADLRDAIHLAPDGKVQVIPATKELGKSMAEQAKTVIALVVGARSRGLGEDPVSLEAVREEAIRKRCYQSKKYVTDHLGSFKGFRAGSKGEILLTSKWFDDFKAAVDRALGREPAMQA